MLLSVVVNDTLFRGNARRHIHKTCLQRTFSRNAEIHDTAQVLIAVVAKHWTQPSLTASPNAVLFNDLRSWSSSFSALYSCLYFSDFQRIQLGCMPYMY